MVASEGERLRLVATMVLDFETQGELRDAEMSAQLHDGGSEACLVLSWGWQGDRHCVVRTLDVDLDRDGSRPAAFVDRIATHVREMIAEAKGRDND